MPAKRTRKTTATTTPQAVSGLGPVPEGWNQKGRDLWAALAASAPWLGAADRQVAEAACRSIASARESWTTPALAQELRALRAVGLVDDLRRRMRERQKARA